MDRERLIRKLEDLPLKEFEAPVHREALKKALFAGCSKAETTSSVSGKPGSFISNLNHFLSARRPVWQLAVVTFLVTVIAVEITANMPGSQAPLGNQPGATAYVTFTKFSTVTATMTSAGQPQLTTVFQEMLSNKAVPQSGDSVQSVNASLVKMTLDDLIRDSSVILIGRVVRISPFQQAQTDNWYGITADTIIQPLHYLYGSNESNVAVRTMGGRIGNQVVWVEDQPEFSLGEEVLLFLKPVDYSVSQPAVGMQPADYYEVVGLIQGKSTYHDGEALSFDGTQLSLAEVEAKIAVIHP